MRFIRCGVNGEIHEIQLSRRIPVFLLISPDVELNPGELVEELHVNWIVRTTV